MGLIRRIKVHLLKTKNRLQDDSYDNILWLIDIVPRAAGFSIRKDNISALFWCVHLPLLFYVYGVGSVVYQWKHAQGVRDSIKNYVSVSIMVLTVNNSWWWLMRRPLLRTVLKDLEHIDKTARESTMLQTKHKTLLKITKRFVLIFYGFNWMDAFFIYIPNRANVLANSYYMTPCVGLEPLASSPNYEVCLIMLAVQEITILSVVLNYQALLLFLISHTAAMYQMLAYEMLAFNDVDDLIEKKALARRKLPIFVIRHSLILDVIDKLKSLYSVPIGVNFGSNAVCISLFFYLPLREWYTFIPILVYCFLVFFFYCFLGQRLINASESFETAVYCCSWENFDLKEQKLIFVMLHQAQKSVELLAADIIPVNISTFASTIQAMFKFVTVVKF